LQIPTLDNRSVTETFLLRYDNGSVTLLEQGNEKLFQVIGLSFNIKIVLITPFIEAFQGRLLPTEQV
jgi:hypothetical protein